MQQLMELQCCLVTHAGIVLVLCTPPSGSAFILVKEEGRGEPTGEETVGLMPQHSKASE